VKGELTEGYGALSCSGGRNPTATGGSRRRRSRGEVLQALPGPLAEVDRLQVALWRWKGGQRGVRIAGGEKLRRRPSLPAAEGKEAGGARVLGGGGVRAQEGLGRPFVARGVSLARGPGGGKELAGVLGVPLGAGETEEGEGEREERGDGGATLPERREGAWEGRAGSG
jgi:hypothetical protein